MFLVIVDTTQIQQYVFGSNRLRENVGASYLVSQATTVWALEAVDEVTRPHNILDIYHGELDPDARIESGLINAEVVYVGGGNAVIIFKDESDKDEPDVDKFIRNLSLKVLTDAPGLQLVIAKEGFDWATNSLVQTVENAFKKLEEKKRSGNLSLPLLGLSVTAMCQSTGLPAVEHVRPIKKDKSDSYDASPEIVAKLRSVRVANSRLIEMFEGNPRKKFQKRGSVEFAFPLDFDNLGRTPGEHSFIAVAHADGDGMGKRIQMIGNNHRDHDGNGNYSASNRNYVKEMQGFSKAVESAGREALKATLNELVKQIDEDGKGFIIKHPKHSEGVAPIGLKLNDSNEVKGGYFLPFRPLVFGGDDVTFVCDGHLGLSLAMFYMRKFADETRARLKGFGGELTSSAGVAIIKSHHPFARAYSLSEGLAGSAKRYKREISYTGACLDWHIALSGLAGPIAEIRRREYLPRGNSLTLLPVTLDENPDKSLRSWGKIEKALSEFQGEQWSTRRNKLKDLREALRFGKDAVEGFLTAYRLKGGLPDISEGGSIRENGWDSWSENGGGYCGYFDAIELTDWFIPMKGE